MRHSIAVLLLALFVSQGSLMAAYKILVSSHTSAAMASKAKERTERILLQNSYYLTHQKEQGYAVYSYPLQNYFVVAIEPIKSESVLNALLRIARQINSNAFAGYATRPASKEPLSNNAQDLQDDASARQSDVPSEQTVVPPPADTSKYLRRKPETSKASDPMLYLYITIAALLLATIFLSLWLLKLKKRLSSVAAREPVAHEAPPSQAHHHDSKLLTDIHSHLIPGIDDGVKHIDEAIELIKRFQKLGYKKIITTPHIMSHRYANSSKMLLSGLEILRERVALEGLDIDIEVASEYFLDEHLMNLIAQFDILTFGNNYLLFEMSYINHPANLEAMIEVMLEAGYTPVLAHPERYVYMAKSFEKYMALKHLGVLFQLNINSIAGYYSEEVRQLALRLIDAGMIDFIGSDVHHSRHMESMEKVIKTEAFRAIFQKNKILNHTL